MLKFGALTRVDLEASIARVELITLVVLTEMTLAVELTGTVTAVGLTGKVGLAGGVTAVVLMGGVTARVGLTGGLTGTVGLAGGVIATVGLAGGVIATVGLAGGQTAVVLTGGVTGGVILTAASLTLTEDTEEGVGLIAFGVGLNEGRFLFLVSRLFHRMGIQHPRRPANRAMFFQVEELNLTMNENRFNCYERSTHATSRRLICGVHHAH